MLNQGLNLYQKKVIKCQWDHSMIFQSGLKNSILHLKCAKLKMNDLQKYRNWFISMMQAFRFKCIQKRLKMYRWNLLWPVNFIITKTNFKHKESLGKVCLHFSLINWKMKISHLMKNQNQKSAKKMKHWSISSMLMQNNLQNPSLKIGHFSLMHSLSITDISQPHRNRYSQKKLSIQKIISIFMSAQESSSDISAIKAENSPIQKTFRSKALL